MKKLTTLSVPLMIGGLISSFSPSAMALSHTWCVKFIPVVQSPKTLIQYQTTYQGGGWDNNLQGGSGFIVQTQNGVQPGTYQFTMPLWLFYSFSNQITTTFYNENTGQSLGSFILNVGTNHLSPNPPTTGGNLPIINYPVITWNNAQNCTEVQINFSIS